MLKLWHFYWTVETIFSPRSHQFGTSVQKNGKHRMRECFRCLKGRISTCQHNWWGAFDIGAIIVAPCRIQIFWNLENTISKCMESTWNMLHLIALLLTFVASMYQIMHCRENLACDHCFIAFWVELLQIYDYVISQSKITWCRRKCLPRLWNLTALRFIKFSEAIFNMIITSSSLNNHQSRQVII